MTAGGLYSTIYPVTVNYRFLKGSYFGGIQFWFSNGTVRHCGRGPPPVVRLQNSNSLFMRRSIFSFLIFLLTTATRCASVMYIAFSVCIPARLPRLLPPLRPPWHAQCKCSMSLPIADASINLKRDHAARAAKIVCVGDIHGQWDENDEMALRALEPDLALFVGDYGNEDVEIAKRVADFAAHSDFNVATVFGNHDAFFTASTKRRYNSPYRNDSVCRVATQIKLLAKYDVSYRSAAFDNLGLSVCGGRSFSSGGPLWRHGQFYREFFGIYDLTQSSEKLSEAVLNAEFNTVIFLSHSGPTGLGDRPEDPCGKDWGTNPGGDFGDADLRIAIEDARRSGKRVPLIVFGHMHKVLQGNRGDRVMVKCETDGVSGGRTVMLNSAVVPRHRRGQKADGKLHHFQIVYMRTGGDVESVEEAWVTRKGEIVESKVIFGTPSVNSVSHTSTHIHVDR